MKRLALLSILVIFSFTASEVFAQKSATPEVRILPTTPGYVKVLYVNNSAAVVNVRISGLDGTIMNDKVKLTKGSKGFLKFYNLKALEPGNYWVEISDAGMEVRYEISFQPNQVVWARHWDSLLPEGEGLASY